MSKMSPQHDIPCPCGGTQSKAKGAVGQGQGQGHIHTYANCCARFIDGGACAPDASLLMRSRYSAYVFERSDYLLSTWDPTSRPETIEFDQNTKWLGLEIKSFKLTSEDSAEVEFVARYRVFGRGQRLHERSHFVLSNQVWLYKSGDMLG